MGEVAIEQVGQAPGEAGKLWREAHPLPLRAEMNIQKGTHNRYKYVKRTLSTRYGQVWQARAWFAFPVGHIYLGTYLEERAAWEVVVNWVRSGGNPCEGLPSGILPKWVRQTPQGYQVVIRQGKREVRLDGFSDAKAAFRVALQCWSYRGWSGGHRNPFKLEWPKVEQRQVELELGRRKRMGWS